MRNAVAAAVLLLAAAMRLVALHDLPPGLSQDEVLNADIAERILAGRHALFFREGYGHEPLFHYFAALFQPLLGDNFLAIRLPAVTLGLLLVALVLRWARRDFGDRAALMAGVLLAVSWWPIVFSRVGLRPILLPLLLVLTAWHLPRRPWRAGLCLGLVTYSYTPGVLMLGWLPLLLAVGALRFVRRRPPPWLRPTAVAAAVAGLVYLPLFVHLRRNPDLLERAGQLRGPVDALLDGTWQPIVDATLRTLGVVTFTGDPRWTYMWPNAPLFDWFTGALIYGGLIIAIRNLQQWRMALLLTWLAVGLLPSMVTPDAPSTIRILGALPPLVVLAGLAVDRLSNALPARRTAVTVALVALTAALTGWRTVTLQMGDWAAHPEARTRYQSVYRDMARDVAARGGVPVVNDGFFAPIDDDSLRRNIGRNPSARWTQRGRALIWPAAPDARLYVPESDPLDPVLAELLAAPLYRQTDSPGFAVYALPAVPTLTPLPPVTFADTDGGRLTLTAIRLLPGSDGSLTLLTLWRVAVAPADDTAIFVHALAADGTLVAQDDALDAVPLSLQPGDTFLQLHRLPPTAATAATGATAATAAPPHELALGLYRRTTGLRLLHGSPPQDVLTLPADPDHAP